MFPGNSTGVWKTIRYLWPKVHPFGLFIHIPDGLSSLCPCPGMFDRLYMDTLADSLAKTMIQLIIFRAIQGLGGGGILTLAMIISEYS